MRFLSWVPSITVFLLAALPVSCGGGSDVSSADTPGEDPPNVVVIMTDDQRADSLQFMPILQSKLADSGITFTNSFVTTPLCCPSRASFLTGQYAHNHGVLVNNGPRGGLENFDDSETLATLLDGAGYNTALIGQYLDGYGDLLDRGESYIPPGWDEWFILNHAYYDFATDENGEITRWEDVYSTDLLREKAVDFIASALPGGPFFLWLTTTAPHDPAIAATRHQGTCDELEIAQPPSFNEADIEDKPAWVQEARLRGERGVAKSLDDERDAICTLKAVDEAVGAIVDALEPELNRTLVVFTSDNGLLTLEHRLSFKENIYEEAIRVPLVVRYPPAGSGTNDRLVLNIDLAPTILTAAGLEVPSTVDGEPIGEVGRDDFLIEIFDEGHPGYAVRTTRYKYHELASGEVELYDLEVDPYELENVADGPAYSAIRAALATRLAELKES
jgi:N-acetylglucosamine-6-sulfatase